MHLPTTPPLRQSARALGAALLAVLAASTAGCGVAGTGGGSGSSPPRAPAARAAAVPAVPTPAGAFDAVIVRVVDGDTVIGRVSGRGPKLRVRLVGVDTPETVKPDTPVACYGHEASAFTKALLPAGSRIRAAYEPGGHTDRYGRQLWDLWLPDGRFVAALLAASGTARAYPFPPQTTYAAMLAGLAGEARSAGRGLWGPPCRGRSFPASRSRSSTSRSG